jgi:hypothetical protein
VVDDQSETQSVRHLMIRMLHEQKRNEVHTAIIIDLLLNIVTNVLHSLAISYDPVNLYVHTPWTGTRGGIWHCIDFLSNEVR